MVRAVSKRIFRRNSVMVCGYSDTRRFAYLSHKGFEFTYSVSKSDNGIHKNRNNSQSQSYPFSKVSESKSRTF